MASVSVTTGHVAKCLSLPNDLVVELGVAAAKERRTQSAIVADLLRDWLDGTKSSAGPRTGRRQRRLEAAEGS